MSKNTQPETATACQKSGIINKSEIIAGMAVLPPARSAWLKGVRIYAVEMIESLENDEIQVSHLERELLGGAINWQESSEGGNHLIYDSDIAERLCTRSELRKRKGGERNPSTRETWLQCQARALSQAARTIVKIARNS